MIRECIVTTQSRAGVVHIAPLGLIEEGEHLVIAPFRPSLTLGGSGGGVAYNESELRTIAERGIKLSPVGEILVDMSLLGWKEYELEVMRDTRGNFVVVCSIENLDPMGVHTGDSITVAPVQTLTDK